MTSNILDSMSFFLHVFLFILFKNELFSYLLTLYRKHKEKHHSMVHFEVWSNSIEGQLN